MNLRARWTCTGRGPRRRILWRHVQPRRHRISHAARVRLLRTAEPVGIGSTRYLAHAGFRALAMSSAGLAFSLGKPDTVDAVPLDTVLAHLRDVVAATPLPVNADFQNHQGLDNRLLTAVASPANQNVFPAAPVSRRERLGGILSYYYYRPAA